MFKPQDPFDPPTSHRVVGPLTKAVAGESSDAKFIDNFSHESDVTSLKTPF